MKLTIGIVGYGTLAEKFHEPSIKASTLVELVGVYDKNYERCRKFDEMKGPIRCYTSYQDMLDDSRIDAVLIATPNAMHCSQVIAAARAGKHVLCEKPMALNMEEAIVMVEACEKAGVTFMVAHDLRYKACNIKAAEVVKKGQLGRVSTAWVRWSFSIPEGRLEDGWREKKQLSGGGQAMNVNSHCIDLLVYIFGKPIKVSAFLQVEQGEEVENGSVVMMEFPGGVLGIAQGSYRESGVSNDLEISASRCSLIVEQACSSDTQGVLRYYPSGTVEKCESLKGPYTLEVDHFAKAVMEKFEPVSSGRKTLDTMQVLMATYRSAETGQHINL